MLASADGKTDAVPVDSAQPPLAVLIRERMAQLAAEGETNESMAARGGWASTSTLVQMRSRRGLYRDPVPPERLEKVATALRLPLEQVRAAAEESMERPVHEVPGARFGQAVRAARMRLNWSLQRAADESRKRGYRLTKQAIHQIETGQNMPSERTINALVETLGIPRREAREAFEQAREARSLVLPANIAYRVGPHNERTILALIEAYLDSQGHSV